LNGDEALQRSDRDDDVEKLHLDHDREGAASSIDWGWWPSVIIIRRACRHHQPGVRCVPADQDRIPKTLHRRTDLQAALLADAAARCSARHVLLPGPEVPGTGWQAPASPTASSLPATATSQYLQAVEDAFGGDIDYAVLVKIYGAAPEGQRRYSPAVALGSQTCHREDPCRFRRSRPGIPR
jgi:hypothetical protein